MKAAGNLLGTSHNHENWIPILELSAQEVFEMMVGTKLESVASLHESALDISAVVGLAGQLKGFLRILTTRESAALMVFRMTGIAAGKESPEATDALGEICNMVAGNFKNKISGLGDGCMLSVPTVVTGNDFRGHELGTPSPLEVRFLFDAMPILISLEIN
ncbi:MAG TPA: chemotaxis protein CheX [Candidatus Acidoferrales bacterium]|nr:chemotaxis protein CheX [Candidatus Acidoferrales bacterium]